jgi:hypothetical protein
MARPKKTGLEYFPLDVVLGDDVELLEAECGLAGFAILVKLWQKIYANGYYIEWEEDNVLLFSRKINTDLTVVNDVINRCFKRNLFSQELYFTHRILTSKGIQKRYLQACKSARRQNYDIEKAYDLVNTEKTGVNSEETTDNEGKPPVESTQSKVKKSKGKESIYINDSEEINSEETQEVKRDAFFDKCWAMYPEQVGIAQISDENKETIFVLGEEFERAIKRYIESVEIRRENGFTQLPYQNGSRFFKSGYQDYLDGTYKPVERKKPKNAQGQNGFHNFEQDNQEMTNDEIEVMLGTRQMTVDGRTKDEIMKGAS